MNIFQKLQEQLENNYMKLVCKMAKKEPSYKFAMKNNKMTSCCTLSIEAETEKKKKLINDKLKTTVIKYTDRPDKLIQHIKFCGIKVYNLKCAEKLLEYFGEEEGFLTPQKGLEAFVINLVTGFLCEKKLNLKFSTEPLFIFADGTVEIYTIARAMHKYYGYKHKLPGFDYHSQKLFKKICNSKNKTSSPFGQCSIEKMYACKAAIQRDIESINFSIMISTEIQGAKHALKKLKETKSAKV